MLYRDQLQRYLNLENHKNPQVICYICDQMKHGQCIIYSTFKAYVFWKHWSGCLWGSRSRNFLWIRAATAEFYGDALPVLRLNPFLPSCTMSCKVLRNLMPGRIERLCWGWNLTRVKQVSSKGCWVVIHHTALSGSLHHLHGALCSSCKIGSFQWAPDWDLPCGSIHKCISCWAIGLVCSLIINIGESAARQIQG